MCTILLAWRCVAGVEFIVAANRDEVVARPAAAPGLLQDAPVIIGGRDLLAGGTWLAVTPEGRLAAVTNRPGDHGDQVVRDASRRSRGRLPVRALRTPVDALPEWLSRVRPADYNPFNLLVISGGSATVGHGGDADRLELIRLESGAHVICVHDVDDAHHDKEVRLRKRLAQVLDSRRSPRECEQMMMAMLGDHDTEGGAPGDATCIHGDEYGTVSASMVTLYHDGVVRYRHAAGRPCETVFTAIALRDRR